jgi:hypothetical protein
MMSALAYLQGLRQLDIVIQQEAAANRKLITN